MSLSVLQSTGAGLLLNRLRKELTGEEAEHARALLSRWKRIAAAETATAAAAAVSGEQQQQQQPQQQQTAYTLDDLPRSAAASHSPSAAPPLLSAAAACSASSSSSSAASVAPLAAASSLPVYNPNLHAAYYLQQKASTGGAEADAVSAAGSAVSVDATSRKRTRREADFDWLSAASPSSSSSAASLPQSPVLICSLLQMCLDAMSGQAFLSSVSSLCPLPVPLALSVLARASAEDLRRIERCNAWLQDETDELWRALCLRRWGAEAEADWGSRGQGGRLQWRQLYDLRLREKDERLARLGQRLRQRLEGEKQEARRQAVKLMDAKQASSSIQGRQRRRGPAAAQPEEPNEKKTSGVGRLQQLRKSSSSLSASSSHCTGPLPSLSEGCSAAHRRRCCCPLGLSICLSLSPAAPRRFGRVGQNGDWSSQQPPICLTHTARRGAARER